jgi:hypothetical protein
MHGILDPLLLNSTAVSEFLKTLRKKHTKQKSEYSAQTQKQAIQIPAMLWSQQKSEIAL